MFKFLLFSLLAIHCNCQKYIEIGGADVQRKSDLPFGVNAVGVSRGLPLGFGGVRYSGLGVGVQPVGELGYQSIGVQPFGGLGVSRFSTLNGYGLRPGYGLGIGALNLGVSQYGVRPIGLGVAPAVQPALGVGLGYGQNVGVGLGAVGLGLGYGQKIGVSQQVVPVSAAVQQTGRTVEYRPVPFTDEPIVPQVVEVEPSDIPLHIHFKSRSSSIRLTQEHIPGAPGTVEETKSQDEPSKVVHEVVKPVIQEVREVITPYRQVIQEVQPVIERVHTIVAKGEGERRQFIAQPIVPNIEAVGVRAVRPAVAQPIAQIQAIEKQVAIAPQVLAPAALGYGAYRSVDVSQPFVGYGGIRSVGVSPLAVGVAQPGLSTLSFAQPGIAIGDLRTDIVKTGLLGSRLFGVGGVGVGDSVVSKTVVPGVEYDSTYESKVEETKVKQ